MKYRIVVWGTGAVYNRHVNLLKYYEYRGETEVHAITSNDIFQEATLDGYKLLPPQKLKDVEYDYLIIMSERSFFEIRKEAIEKGIEDEKILSYKFLDLPNLVFDQYIQLKKSRISIISNNCWGGIVYNALGLKCLSPFKNLFLEDEPYLRMLENLDYYLDCEPDFYGEFATDAHSGKRYPVIRLDDIPVHCNHDENYESAIQTWNRRAKKLNRDNLFVEMYTDKEEFAKRFSRFDQFSNKICFVPFQCAENSLYHLPLGPRQSELWEAVLSNARNDNNSISYNVIDLLCGRECRRYHLTD